MRDLRVLLEVLLDETEPTSRAVEQQREMRERRAAERVDRLMMMLKARGTAL